MKKTNKKKNKMGYIIKEAAAMILTSIFLNGVFFYILLNLDKFTTIYR